MRSPYSTSKISGRQVSNSTTIIKCQLLHIFYCTYWIERTFLQVNYLIQVLKLPQNITQLKCNKLSLEVLQNNKIICTKNVRNLHPPLPIHLCSFNLEPTNEAPDICLEINLLKISFSRMNK